ncbi:hypothetical protein A2U01_0092905, partial [Trifolium medium]|nr:hypothetical protein [Trifolium medium]
MEFAGFGVQSSLSVGFGVPGSLSAGCAQ